MRSLNEAVEVNFGAKPFAFDVDALLQQERGMEADAIAGCDAAALAH